MENQIRIQETAGESTTRREEAIGRTVLETVAKPVQMFGLMEEFRPLRSTPTQERTWDPQMNRPDSVPDISQE